MARRTGRGRLSSIELLPPEAGPIKAWAFAQLRARERLQIDILAEFNQKLAALAKELGRRIAPISLTAFNRQAFRTATLARISEERRDIVATLSDRLKPGQTDDLTIVAGELLKMRVMAALEAAEIAEDGGEVAVDTKGIMELARAFQSAVAAQKMSSDRRAKLDKENAENAAKAARAVDKIGKAKGLTAKTVADIKKQVLGVRT
jgi:hypothetical protein